MNCQEEIIFNNVNNKNNYIISKTNNQTANSKYLENINQLKKKIDELNERIKFINKYAINIDNNIDNNIEKIINKFDFVINQINTSVINNAQFINKNNKIIEYDF
jgi:hypothetical protein